MDAMDGQEGAADALENPRFSCDQGKSGGFRGAFIGRKIPTHEKLAKADGEDVEEPLRREACRGEVASALGESAGGIEAFALGEPLEVAALAPMGEIDFGDGGTIEVCAEDGLDFGLGVQPGGEFPACFAFEKAQVELFPDVVREIC